MFYNPLFEVAEIPNRETFILAILRNIIVEINTSYPEYVEMIEALAEEHIVLIADRLQVIGERPFCWGVVLTVYGTCQAFQLWCSQSKRYAELTAEERAVMLALTECDGIATMRGSVYLDSFEGRRREIEFDVSPTTLQSLAEKRLICLTADRTAWIACGQPIY